MSHDALAESLFSKVVDLEQANLALKSLNADLLGALKDVAREARHPDYDWPLWLSRQVDYVIAKATGEQP